MSKSKKKTTPPVKETQYKDDYKIKTDAVDKLVQAHSLTEEKIKDEAEEIGAERKQYKTSTLSKIPVWVKALFIKYWFFGAINFFFYIGLGLVLPDEFDRIVVMIIATGIVTDLLVNNIFRFFSTEKQEYYKYMMVSLRKWWTLFLNIPYAAMVIIPVVYIYSGLNQWIISAQGLSVDSVPLGVEPLLYGLFCLIVDMALISVKNLIVKLVKPHEAKNGSK